MLPIMTQLVDGVLDIRQRGMRIAQLIVQRVELVGFNEVEELDDTARGDGGYGSTGVN